MRWQPKLYRMKPPYPRFALFPVWCVDTEEYVWLERVYYRIKPYGHDIVLEYYSDKE